jgi:hypothetical protein
VREFTGIIKGELDVFADGAEQADDITMLVLKYRGGGEKELKTEARPKNLGTIL